MRLVLALALCAVVSGGGAGRAVDLVGARGSCQAEKLGLAPLDDTPVRVVSAVGAPPGRVPLLNRVFGISLPTSKLFGASPTLGVRAAVCPAAADAGPIIVIDGGACGRAATSVGDDDAVSDEQAIAFSQGLADVVLVNVWQKDTRPKADGAMLECIARERAAGAAAKKTLLLFVVHDDDGKDTAARQEQLKQALTSACDAASVAESDLFDVEFTSLPPTTDERYETTVEALCERFTGELPRAEHSQGVTAAEAASKLQALWADVCARRGAAEEAAVDEDAIAARIECDGAFSELSDRAEGTLVRWRTTVDSGRAVAGFGAKAGALHASTLKEYDELTAEAQSAAKAARREQLGTLVSDAIKDLHTRQLEDAARAATRALKLRLLKAQRAAKDAVVSPDAASAAKEAAEFAFDAAATALEVEELGLSVAQAKRALADETGEVVAGFAGSTAAQLQANRVQEKAARSQRPAQKQRGLVCGLQLVSMIRPKGYASLQGFLNYALGPHSLLVGVANDGDVATTPTGGPVPFFRFQPKLELNADL